MDCGIVTKQGIFNRTGVFNASENRVWTTQMADLFLLKVRGDTERMGEKSRWKWARNFKNSRPLDSSFLVKCHQNTKRKTFSAAYKNCRGIHSM